MPIRIRGDRGDRSAPRLQQTTPADNAIDVPVGNNLTLTFNENVQAGSGLIKIYKSDGTLFRSISATDASQVTFSGRTVTIDPSINLVGGTNYYVLIDNGAIKDSAGNNYGGISSSRAFNFATSGAPIVDTTPPVLSSTDPENYSTGFDIAGNLVLTFSESIQRGSGDIELYNWADGTSLTIDVNDTSQVTLAGNQIILNPTSNLATNTSYYIMLDAGVVKDQVGNSSAEVEAGMLTFTTNDLIAPALVASTPFDGETNSAFPVIILVFDEPMRAGTGSVQIFQADGTLFNSIDINDTNLVYFTNGERTVYIATWLGFTENTGYYVIIPTGVLEDFAGNDYAGILSPDGLNFSLDYSAPQLLSTSPLTDVLPDGAITLTFDEAVKASTGQIVITSTETGQALAYIDADDTTQVTIAGNVVTIDPIVHFEADTEYYVDLTIGPISDLSGNNFSGYFYLTTASGEADAPLLLSTTPADGSTGVATDANITLQFDESVFAGSGAFELRRVSDEGLAESIAVTDASCVTIDGDTVTINPNANLAANTEYYLTIAPGAVEDVWGNDFAGLISSSFNFTTLNNPDLVLTGNGQSNTLIGGAGNDTITGLGGKDTLTGAAGSDAFIYGAASDSTSRNYDTITDFNAIADVVDLWFQVTGVDASITGGSVAARRFDSDLAAAVNGAKLAPHHAVLYTPNSGVPAGSKFLIVDANGVAGYQGGADVVILLGGNSTNLGSLTVSDFV